MNAGHIHQRRMLLGEIILESTPASAGLAREAARDIIGHDHPIKDDVALVVSELVTNAFKYSDRGGIGAVIRLALFSEGPVLRVEVSDRGSAHEIPRCEAPYADGENTDAESGRGLVIVDGLSQGNWGSHTHDQGRTVWCELAAEPIAERCRP
ncbi:ATP-binding protein [Streptosporangium sp. NPDC000563]|uniref:ATP-binding protein n=1 Tax=Streptosporangium sp. NPDC000563 TaxID=3154366 RepID=UPI0033349A71